MKANRRFAALLAVCLAACTLSGCGEKIKKFFAHDGTYVEESSDAAEESSIAETEPAATEPAETKPIETETNAVTDPITTTTETIVTTEILPSGDAQDNDTKLLWSERGLEIVPIDSQDGYGTELKTGETYLDWTLVSFDGQVSGNSVSDLQADFTYGNGALSVNGIVTILPSTDANNPDGLYLRVDNQAEFPYFPADTRERGKFIVANKDEVYKMLGYDSPADVGQSELAVTMSVESLHIHYSADGFDTIVVTAASRR